MRWEVELCRQDVKGCPGRGNRMYKRPATGVGLVCRVPARKPAWLGRDEGRGVEGDEEEREAKRMNKILF